MTHQPDLFTPFPPRRWSQQCERIYQRLQRGPATNQELAQLALKYTSRISDLRKGGVCVECIEHDHVTGRTVYALTDRAVDARDRTD